MKESTDILKVIAIAKEAGELILEVYNSKDFEIELKDDNSPLTKADKASHAHIKNELTKIYPDIPVLSEEGREIDYEERKNWKIFWCVDPLDGTKEFIKRNGEFTVNIALIENNFPVAGVIHIPVENVTYYSISGRGSYKIDENSEPIKLSVSDSSNGIIAVTSRSHSSDEEKDILSIYDIAETISVGSSIKFCMIAEGRANLFYRHGQTWEWDTAAGHSIVMEAGGRFKKGLEPRYNKEKLLNSSFMCFGNIDVE